jgi:hypothetical protein
MWEAPLPSVPHNFVTSDMRAGGVLWRPEVAVASLTLFVRTLSIGGRGYGARVANQLCNIRLRKRRFWCFSSNVN